MSAVARAQQKKERTVIDEALIRQAVLEDRAAEKDATAQSVGGMIDEDEKRVDFDEVTSLILSFKSILRIENLQGFENLTKLQLDNNHLEKIENLGHLVNLTWLDLSFNQITVIENLDKLTKLKDLSLFHNNISKVQGLEKLTQLQILSLGHNQIASLEDIHSLRPFKRLNCLIMKENPVCKDENYIYTVAAYLKSLKFLDYELVNPALVKAAREERHEELQEIEEKERTRDSEEAKSSEAAKRRVVADEANLLGVESLLDDMFRDDIELGKLRHLPGYAEILDSYRDEFDELTGAFVGKIMDKFKNKKEEIHLFTLAMDQLKSSCERSSVELIDGFSKIKKLRFVDLQHQASLGQIDSDAVEQLRAQLQDMADNLMELEVSQIEQVNSLIDDLYSANKEISADCLTHINNYCGRLLELEKQYYESAQNLTSKLIERYQSGTLMQAYEDSGLPTDWKSLLEDREALNTSVNTSHEKHEENINNLEGRISDRERTYADKQLSKYRDLEYQRNRQRVSEIFNLVERHKADIDRLLQSNAAAHASSKEEDM